VAVESSDDEFVVLAAELVVTVGELVALVCVALVCVALVCVALVCVAVVAAVGVLAAAW
jgi:hypothetical protein